MFRGAQMTREFLIDNARAALIPLFETYVQERESGEAWREEMARTAGAFSRDPMFDTMQYINLYAIADCVALLTDNIVRIWSRAQLGDGNKRKAYGTELAPGVTAGQVLWAAGNAARHYEDASFFAGTEAVLDAFGVKARDERVTHLLLEAAGIKTEGDALRQVNAICDGIDAATQAEKGAQQPGR